MYYVYIVAFKMTYKINQHIGQHEVQQDHLLLFLQEDQMTHSKLDLSPSLHFVRIFSTFGNCLVPHQSPLFSWLYWWGGELTRMLTVDFV